MAATPYTLIKDAEKFSSRSSVLPSCRPLAIYLQSCDDELATDLEDLGWENPESNAWLEHKHRCAKLACIYMDEYLRLMKGDSQGAMPLKGVSSSMKRHGGRFDQLRHAFYIYTHKSTLIATLQAAEFLLSSTVANPSFFRVLNGRSMLIDSMRYLAEEPSETDVARAQLLNAFCLLLFIVTTPMPNTKLPFWNEADLSKFNRTAKELRDGKKSNCEQHTFGIDPAWFEDLVLSCEMHQKTMVLMKCFAAKQKPIAGFLEERTMGLYLEFLSDVIAVLKQQVDTATTLQNKLLSGVMTGMFMLISFLFNRYVKPADQEFS